MGIKVLHLSSFDASGGAARAAYRVHQGLQGLGVDSQMLVQFKSGRDRTVEQLDNKIIARLRSSLDSSLLKLRRQSPQQLFSLEWFPNALAARITQINPDIVNLNWVCSSFLQIEALTKLRMPLVWTLQDMWAFTGGCHYSLGCNHYQKSCGHCPQLQSSQARDFSRWVWHRKMQAWKDLNLTLVAPSQWMANCARSASLFQNSRVEVIPFALDTTRFSPFDVRAARELLKLPQNKRLVLFGAISAIDDRRKGFHLLQAALKELPQYNECDQLELVVFGADAPAAPIDLGFKTHYLGHLHDDLSLRAAYAAADVMIAPSIEEAFGQTASEALACGTPAVVFSDTGLEDIVDHQQNGYVARYGDIRDLAQGIAWVLANSERHCQLRTAARQKAETAFSLESVAHANLALYNSILSE